MVSLKYMYVWTRPRACNKFPMHRDIMALRSNILCPTGWEKGALSCLYKGICRIQSICCKGWIELKVFPRNNVLIEKFLYIILWSLLHTVTLLFIFGALHCWMLGGWPRHYLCIGLTNLVLFKTRVLHSLRVQKTISS